MTSIPSSWPIEEKNRIRAEAHKVWADWMKKNEDCKRAIDSMEAFLRKLGKIRQEFHPRVRMAFPASVAGTAASRGSVAYIPGCAGETIPARVEAAADPDPCPPEILARVTGPPCAIPGQGSAAMFIRPDPRLSLAPRDSCSGLKKGEKT